MNFRRPLCLVFSWCLSVGTAYGSDLLHGKIQQSDRSQRIQRPKLPNAAAAKPTGNSSGAASNLKSFVDTSDFDFAKKMSRELPRTAVVPCFPEPAAQSDKKAIASGATDSELLIAWEQWHKRVSEAIYQNWVRNSKVLGVAHTTIRVTRDRHITVTVHDVSVDQPGLIFAHSLGFSPDKLEREFQDEVIQSVEPLDGSSILDFPEKSRRLDVSFTPYFRKQGQSGYDWKKDDYERVPVN